MGSGKAGHNNTGTSLKILLCHQVIYYSQYAHDRAVQVLTPDLSGILGSFPPWKNQSCMYSTRRSVLKEGAGSSRAPPSFLLQGGEVC